MLIVSGGRVAHAFTLLGQELGFGQRDVRVFDNFSDTTAHDNTLPDAMFPGAIGLELSLWKGMIEWGSGPHGDGSGDVTQGTLGSGDSNFDALWSGVASNAGTSDQNIVSAITSCSSGVLAFAEGPSDNGWRIRFCDGGISFDDGPGSIPAGFYDIQSIMAHEYGHVLGLGHSSILGATMAPSIGAGSESGRSINSDDRAGILSIYGAKTAGKPIICATGVRAGILTITGTGFDDFNNTVWFTNKNITAPGTDPRVQVSGLFSSRAGTEIQFALPGGARAGDLIVKLPSPGGSYDTISNAFPLDPNGRIANQCDLQITSISPDMPPPLAPGSTQDVTLFGAGFLTAISVTLEPGLLLDPSQWSAIDDSEMTLDLPVPSALGPQTLTLQGALGQASIGFSINQSALPILQVGTGEDLNAIGLGENISVLMAGPIGSVQTIVYSLSPLPSDHNLIHLELGNSFGQLFYGPTSTITPNGVVSLDMPSAYGGAPIALYIQSVDLSASPAPQFPVSNLESVTLQP